MKAGCKFYYEGTYRGKVKMECRLISLNPASEPWNSGLCRTCPVPKLLKANPCYHLALEATVKRWLFFFQRVDIYAICTAKLVEVKSPITCQQGCEHYREVR